MASSEDSAQALGRLTGDEREIFRSLSTPALIQEFLDSIPYSADPIYRSPRSVLRDRKAHCFDGALFAAAALRLLGHPPLLLDMRAERDDDHILAVFKQGGLWGAVAKSNFVGLRFREPIYRGLRELVMSYFEQFYNVDREKTLRAYSVPLDLAAFDRLDWIASDEGLDVIARRLDLIRHYPVIAPGRVAGLSLLDERSFAAGMLGAVEAGLYKPPGRKL
ncbi:MAG TPA: hypothetical protein VHQ90_05260 [Thermoanaerobaculia bacterium]|nr:hypothetical protein [Thermoanaerobaculia bacterium]